MHCCVQVLDYDNYMAALEEYNQNPAISKIWINLGVSYAVYKAAVSMCMSRVYLAIQARMHTHVRWHTTADTHTHVRTQKRTHAHVHTHSNTRVYGHTQILTHNHRTIETCPRTDTHTHTHTQIQTHTHTHTRMTCAPYRSKN